MDDNLIRRLRDVPQGEERPLYYDTMVEAADEIERLQAKLGFWMRNSERNREQARVNHDCYLRLWSEHGGLELPERLRTNDIAQ